MSARLRIPALLAAAAVCASGSCAVEQDLYSESLRRVFVLCDRSNATLLPLGRSEENRALAAIVVTNSEGNLSSKLRVMVCAGQHGDEPNAVRAALDLASRIGRSDDLVSGCVFLFVPMVNPDGLAAGRRTNARGLDVNRDWLLLNTAGARFVDGLARTWRPHVVFDLHEWTEAPRGPADSVEVAACPDRSRQSLMAALARNSCHSSGSALVQSSIDASGNLLHRRLTALGHAAFLVETGPEKNVESKSRLYAAVVLAAVEMLKKNPGMAAAIAPGAQVFDQTAACAQLRPQPPLQPRQVSVWQPIGLFALACLVLLLTARNARQGNCPAIGAAGAAATWSRRFRRCVVDERLPADRLGEKHCLVPLTQRSWTRRRLRRSATPLAVGTCSQTLNRRAHIPRGTDFRELRSALLRWVPETTESKGTLQTPIITAR